MLGTPPFTRADAVLQAGEELLQEFGDPQEWRVAIRKAVEAVDEVEAQSLERRDRSREAGRYFAEAQPELREGLLADAEAARAQRWLGHHSAAFTLATYTLLLDGDLGAPLCLTGKPAVPSIRGDEHADEGRNVLPALQTAGRG